MTKVTLLNLQYFGDLEVHRIDCIGRQVRYQGKPKTVDGWKQLKAMTEYILETSNKGWSSVIIEEDGRLMNEWVSEWVSKWVSELLVCHRSVKAWLLIEVAICRMSSFQCGSRKFQWSSRLTVTQKQSRLSMCARWRWTEVRFAELGLRTSGSSRQWWVFSRNFASPAGTHTTQRDRHLRSSTSRQWS